MRRILDLTGVVQGVGFRPALYRLAREAGLGGWVQNRSGSVRLALEGEVEEVEEFLSRLPGCLPANARLDSVVVVSEETLAPGVRADFEIRESAGDEASEVLIPADLATCPDCVREVMDPANRRYGYPFTTCTLCGPRYTVVNAMPYDRERTTLKEFPLCLDCQGEYTRPADRRFHAESTACPVCGPQVWLEDSGGIRIRGNPIRMARAALACGEVIAVRGMGGFLLAVDAMNPKAVQVLRDRKLRPHKPFAVMARNLDVAAQYARVSAPEAALLSSPEAPLVILDILPGALGTGLPLDVVTPDTKTLGVMLPTTALHHLLMNPIKGDATPAFDLLIMTSGNRRGEPICIRNEEARERLAGIADGFLMHDREINLRNDDSVCVVRGGKPQVWRRARGYAPNPIVPGVPLRRTVLAMGADMKNAVAMGSGNRVVLSPYGGDLDTPEALDGLNQVARTLPAFLQWRPEVVVVDAHPDMQSRRLGEKLAGEWGIPVVEVQHHHAHAVACLAENGASEGLVLVMDGTGWGGDGTLWGAECLDVRGGRVRRLATFLPVPLPGGDAAVRHPARQVVGRWIQAGIALTDDRLARLGVTREEAGVWEQQGLRKVNAPLTHAAGRLFDSFSAVLGWAPQDMTYEGQPAIRLEAVAREWTGGTLPEIPFTVTDWNGVPAIDWAPAFRVLAERDLLKDDPCQWAMAVHVAIARAAMVMISGALLKVPERRVGLSGGVFMNRILHDLLVRDLEQQGVTVLCHRQTPPGDGCIALGQAVLAGG